jgi:hypothetical protein
MVRRGRPGAEMPTTTTALSLVNPLLGALTVVVLVLLALLVFTLRRPADVEPGLDGDRAPNAAAHVREPADP